MYADLEKLNNILDLFNHQVSRLADKPYLWKKNNDKYESISWKETELQIKAIASSLINLGILRGDRVVIISENIDAEKSS